MSIKTTIEHSVLIATRSNANKVGHGDLHYHANKLYRYRDGKLYLVERGGGARAVERTPRWLTHEQAAAWIATEARDPVTGWGYTSEQAEQMLAGVDCSGDRRD